jgi:hypothetical protein
MDMFSKSEVLSVGKGVGAGKRVDCKASPGGGNGDFEVHSGSRTISTHEEASNRVNDSTGDVEGKGDELGSGTVSAHEAENEGVGDTRVTFSLGKHLTFIPSLHTIAVCKRHAYHKIT